MQAVWEALAALNRWLASSAAFPAQCLDRWQAQAGSLAPRLRPLNLLCAYPSTERAHLHSLGDGQAIAWCEMARGLLLHWLQLDGEGAVAQYRVRAPTEWNFHPQGALALALAACAPQDVVAAQTLAAAFAPCVECSVVTPPTPERAHA